MAITLRLSKELDKRLSLLAQKTHRSKSYYATEALEYYIEDLEDYYLAMRVLENLKKTYTLEEVEEIIDKSRPCSENGAQFRSMVGEI